jgi:hypothetical protein
MSISSSSETVKGFYWLGRVLRNYNSEGRGSDSSGSVFLRRWEKQEFK